MIPVYEPDLHDEDIQAAKLALESTWISSIGEYKDKAAERLAKLMGVKYALLVNNGTAATHLLAHAIKFKRPGVKTILVPDNVYVAAWNAFLYGPIYHLVPVSTNLDTWNIDVDRLLDAAKKSDPNDTAILIVHNLGNPVNVPEIQKEIPDHLIVEDNCEGFLGRYGGKFIGGDLYTGTQCLASSVSFYGNKSVTCGEGGAVLTNDDALCEHLCMLHTQGQSEQRFLHHVLGYNYRMTNVQAALLYSQLGRLHKIQHAKIQPILRMWKGFPKTKRLRPQWIIDRVSHSYWMLGVRIIGSPGYEQVDAFFRKYGIDTRPMFYPMSCHEHLRKYAIPDQEGNARLLNKECVILPSSPKLEDEQVDHIAEIMTNYLEQLGTIS
jgi:perosamine synthetase